MTQADHHPCINPTSELSAKVSVSLYLTYQSSKHCNSSYDEAIVKGYIIDYNLVAKAAKIDASDPDVHYYTRIIMMGLNRYGYKFIGSVHRRIQPGQKPKEKDLALAIVLEIGDDEEALKKMELPLLDDTIEAALPHVLVGPGVWELWG